jgi:hypothetical protein
MSFTILPYINPPCGGLDIQYAVSGIASVDNNFSVSQTMAGLVDSGNLSVAGTSSFSGVCTFASRPVFSAGITVNLDEVDTGTLSVTGLSSLSGGVTVLGAVSLPASSIADSALTSNVPLKNVANTFSLVNTFSQPPVLSGASISSNTIPALAHVNKSLGDAQIALAGIGQTSLVNGYVDLSSVQSIAGAKTFSGAVVVPSLTCTSLSCSSVVDTGTLTCTTLTCSSLLDTGALSSTTATHSGLVSCNAGLTVVGSVTLPATCIGQSNVLNGYVDLVSNQASIAGTKGFTGPVTVASLTCSGASIFSAGMAVSGALTTNLFTANSLATLNAGILLPQSQTVLTTTAGTVAIALGSSSFSEYSLSLTANVTAITFTNPIINAKFNIYITNAGSARNINKNISSGTISQVNNLSGNTSFAGGSTWICRGVVLSATLVSLDFTNYT